jgi:hypothetical protein
MFEWSEWAETITNTFSMESTVENSNFKITDEQILQAEGNENVLKQLYRQTPTLQQEFADCENFLSYCRGLATGRLSRTRQGAVRSSGPVQL